MVYLEGTHWFRRLVKECKKMSPHIRFVRTKYGFYRVYWDRAYIHEVYKDMPQYGHDIYENDLRLIEKKFYEEYEDRAELTRKVKNYIEGYRDSLERIQTRVWLMRHDKDFHEKSIQAYKQHIIK